MPHPLLTRCRTSAFSMPTDPEPPAEADEQRAILPPALQDPPLLAELDAIEGGAGGVDADANGDDDKAKGGKKEKGSKVYEVPAEGDGKKADGEEEGEEEKPKAKCSRRKKLTTGCCCCFFLIVVVAVAAGGGDDAVLNSVDLRSRTPTVVANRLTLVLTVEFATVTNNTDAFVADFQTRIAPLLGLLPAQLVIVDISPGSTVVKTDAAEPSPHKCCGCARLPRTHWKISGLFRSRFPCARSMTPRPARSAARYPPSGAWLTETSGNGKLRTPRWRTPSTSWRLHAQITTRRAVRAQSKTTGVSSTRSQPCASPLPATTTGAPLEQSIERSNRTLLRPSGPEPCFERSAPKIAFPVHSVGQQLSLWLGLQ